MENDIEYWKCLADALRQQRDAALHAAAGMQATIMRMKQIEDAKKAAEQQSQKETFMRMRQTNRAEAPEADRDRHDGEILIDPPRSI